MRNVLVCLLVVIAGGVLAPSSQDLRKQFGEPDLERFMDRPGIAITVEYGSDHSACSVLIEPARPLIRSDESLPLMSSDTVTEILEGIVPVSTRGMSILSTIDSMGCSESRRTEYLDMAITRVRNNCPSPTAGHELRATIAFKRGICQR